MPKVVQRSDYEAIVALYIEGESYAAIGRKFGVGRERIRQIVLDTDPEAKEKRARQERKEREVKDDRREDLLTQRFLDRLQEVIDQDIKCAACGGWVIRDIDTIGENKTCSPECAQAWGVLRSFPEVSGDDHRLHMANSIIRNAENYSGSEVDWAQRMKEEAPPPNRRWVQKGSKRAEILRKYRPEIYERLVR